VKIILGILKFTFRNSFGTQVMWNIIIGAVFLIGGLSGKIAIRGTDSTVGASILGGVLIVWGIIQMVRANSSEE
jgi:hypothetical protein